MVQTIDDATSCITLPEDRFAKALSESPAFIAWTGTADAAEALSHVYIDGLPPPPDHEDEFTPQYLATIGNFAIVATSDQEGFAWEFSAISERHEYLPSGRLTVELHELLDASEQELIARAPRRFKNSLGLIIEQSAGVSGVAEYLAVRRVVLEELYRNGEDEIPAQGDTLSAILSVEWADDDES